MPGKTDDKSANGANDALASARGGAWYEVSRALSEEIGAEARRASTAKEVTRQDLETKETVAKSALEERVNTFSKRMQRQSDANAKWLEMVRTNGTASDKVAANVLSVTEDPAANLKAL